jgi:hypothetical protein
VEADHPLAQHVALTETAWLMLMQGLLAIEGGIDITNPTTLEAQLWRGVTQVVCAVGPVFGRTPDGNMGYCRPIRSNSTDGQIMH